MLAARRAAKISFLILKLIYSSILGEETGADWVSMVDIYRGSVSLMELT
jgi:hypothetical protein